MRNKIELRRNSTKIKRIVTCGVEMIQLGQRATSRLTNNASAADFGYDFFLHLQLNQKSETFV
jgi:hypothetical protein